MVILNSVLCVYTGVMLMHSENVWILLTVGLQVYSNWNLIHNMAYTVSTPDAKACLDVIKRPVQIHLFFISEVVRALEVRQK